MTKTRVEAFSDGVLAIVITIMVLELKAPHDPHFRALIALWPVLLSYLLAYVNVGMYWTNHHHLLHMTERVDGAILWANLHLLFWLSLVPFVTAWRGEHFDEPAPAALMGAVLFGAALAYRGLERAIIHAQGTHSRLQDAIGRDTKGSVTACLYAGAIPLAFVHPWLSDALYLCVALMWFAPDQRIERRIKERA